MHTDSGATFLITVMSGFQTSPMAGFHIATAIGCTNRTTAGRGLDMSRGAGRHITTDAGSGTAVRGRGGLVQWDTTHSGRRLTFRSGAGAAVGALVSDLVVGAD